jgi:hypothetical protein
LVKKRALVILLDDSRPGIVDVNDNRLDASDEMRWRKTARVAAREAVRAARPSIGRPSLG